MSVVSAQAASAQVAPAPVAAQSQVRATRLPFADLIRLYVGAVKPGIVMSNTLVTAAAYIFAADIFSAVTLLAVVFGTACIIGSACVVNNHFDRDIDARMARTQGRGQVTGFISPLAATAYSYVLGLAGVTILAVLTTPTTLLLGVTGWVTYALVYTWSKHHTVHSTVIGTVPGAIPPVAGYAATGRPLDATALALFLLLVAWQLVHFYAISIRRRDDYAAAGVPVAAVAYGVTRTKRLILVTAVLNLAATVLLVFSAQLSTASAIVLTVLAIFWLALSVPGQRAASDAVRWATRMFIVSLVDIVVICGVLVVEPLLR